MKYKFIVDGKEFEKVEHAYGFQLETRVREKLEDIFHEGDTWDVREITEMIYVYIKEINEAFNVPEVEITVVREAENERE